jgi:peptidyl-prolyl cis-trans isomerase SurA
MKRLCAIIAVGFLAGLASTTRAELTDGIRVVVHNAVITYQQVEEIAAPLVEEYRQKYRSDPQVFQKKLQEVLDDNTERLIEGELILHDFATSEMYAFPESIIDEQLKAYIKSNFGDDRVRFIKTLQAEGKTYEQYRKEYRDHLIIQEMRYMRNSKQGIISPHKIEVYYVDHQNDFKVESEVKLRMIVLNKSADDAGQTRKLAEEILGKIKDGGAFAEMAGVYSQGSQRSQGGDWGWVEKSVLRKELAESAFVLKPGETSGVIETAEACYLMLVEDTRPEHIRPLTEVRAKIEADLLNLEKNRLQKQWIERLRKKTFVRYF